MKMLTEKEAWLFIAKCWRKACKWYSDEWGTCIATGICPYINRLYGGRTLGDGSHMCKITVKTYESMHKKIATLAPPPIDLAKHRWPTTRDGARARVRFCVKMAKEI